MKEEKGISTANDPLTDSFRVMLSNIFKAFIFISTLAFALLVSFSIFASQQMDSGLQLILTCIFWVLAATVFVLATLKPFLTDRLPARRKKLYKWLAIVSVIICAMAYALTIFPNHNVLIAMMLGTIVMFIAGACWNNLKYLKKEADRAFLIACFSGIVSLLALVVAIVTLIVTITGSKL